MVAVLGGMVASGAFLTGFHTAVAVAGGVFGAAALVVAATIISHLQEPVTPEV